MEFTGTPEHLRKLEKGVETWNKWREKNPDITPNLKGATLNGATLNGANLKGVWPESFNLKSDMPQQFQLILE